MPAFLKALGSILSQRQAITLAALMVVSIVSGFLQWGIVAHVSRLRPLSDVSTRLLPFGLGSWHIGMLRRSWYPVAALPLRRWVILTYGISMACVVVAFVLIVSWVVVSRPPHSVLP